jgi:hypothetical protein
MNNNYYKSPKPSWLMRQFWKACGADAYLLERSTYSDQIKYFCLGGIVVATGVMAAMAGGYAFYTIFEPKGDAVENIMTSEALNSGANPRDFIHWPTVLLSTFFGLIWGLIIYNIDRFIVTSTGKGDGTEAITGQEIKSAIPRIIMGMIIALTISKPIEIRMFKTEIDAKLYEQQLELEKDFEIRTRKNFEDRINDLEKDDKIISEKANAIIRKINIKDSLYNVETTEGQGGRGEGEGPVAKALKAERERLEKQLESFQSNNKKKIESIEKRKAQIYKELDKALSNNKTVASGLNGLLQRISIISEIVDWKITTFITLLFMVIELTPIFFKMMLIKGPYDYMDENVKELARAESGIQVIYNFYKSKEELKNESADLSDNHIQKNKILDGYDVHKVINHAAELKAKERLIILKAQEELNEEIVRNWKEKKLKDIKENPDKYVDEQ